jgi:hypothetical protein
LAFPPNGTFIMPPITILKEHSITTVQLAVAQQATLIHTLDHAESLIEWLCDDIKGVAYRRGLDDD